MAGSHEERSRSVVRLVGERQRRSGQCLTKQHGACVKQRRRQLCRHGQVEEHARTATATGGVEERRTGADAAEAWHQAWGGHDEREHCCATSSVVELRRQQRASNVDSQRVCQHLALGASSVPSVLYAPSPQPARSGISRCSRWRRWSSRTRSPRSRRPSRTRTCRSCRRRCAATAPSPTSSTPRRGSTCTPRCRIKCASRRS